MIEQTSMGNKLSFERLAASAMILHMGLSKQASKSTASKDRASETRSSKQRT